jgi:hypothetical protein
MSFTNSWVNATFTAFMYGEAFSNPVFDIGNDKRGILNSLIQGSKADSVASMNKVVSSNGPTIPCALGMGHDLPPQLDKSRRGFFKWERR